MPFTANGWLPFTQVKKLALAAKFLTCAALLLMAGWSRIWQQLHRFFQQEREVSVTRFGNLFTVWQLF